MWFLIFPKKIIHDDCFDTHYACMFCIVQINAILINFCIFRLNCLDGNSMMPIYFDAHAHDEGGGFWSFSVR
jgi:hypothetical protein